LPKGDLSAYLAKQYKQQKITAIDNIEDNIIQAKNLYSLSNLTFETADAPVSAGGISQST
jgi:trans-aconitate methyltransferase